MDDEGARVACQHCGRALVQCWICPDTTPNTGECMPCPTCEKLRSQIIELEAKKSADIDDRYSDYKRGWLFGASNEPDCALIGTNEPKHPAEFEMGRRHGQDAFKEAMGEKWKNLGKYYG